MSTWPALPTGGAAKPLDITRRLRAMDVEIYGAIFAEEGIISGNLSVTGDLTISGNTQITGTLDVDGAVDFSSTLNITGATTIHGQIVTFTDPSLATLFIDMGADVNGYLSFYSGPYAIRLNTPYDNTGDDQYEAYSYLQAGNASDDAYWRLYAEGANSNHTGILGYAAGAVWDDASIAFEVGGETWTLYPNSLERTAASLPHIILDSVGSGDTWTAQGAYVKLGEGANTEAGANALSLSYVGDGYAYFGNGGMTTGVPAYGFAVRHNTQQMLALGDGTTGNPFYGFLSDPDTGMRRFGANVVALTAGGTDVLKGGNSLGLESIVVYNKTTASAANVNVAVTTGLLARSTSARKYKAMISPLDVDIDLRPVSYWSRLDEEWQWGQIADDLAAQDARLGVYDEDGEVEDYDLRAVAAVMALKINRLEARVKELENG